MTDPRSLLDAGLAHHRAGRLDEAARHYRRALELDGDAAEPFHLLGIVAMQSGRPAEAIERFYEADRRDPGNAKYLANLGAALLTAGRAADAVSVLERAIERDAGTVDGWCNLAAALHGAGRTGDAVSAWRRAGALAPEDPSVPSGLATACLTLGRLDDALDAADRAVSLDPDNGDWRNIRGGVLLSMARYDDAAVELERAVELAPDLADARCNLALAYQNLQRLEDAASAYRTAVDRWPDNASAHAGLGRTLRLQGRLRDAVSSYRRAVALRPGNARTHSSLLFTLLGDPDTDAAALYRAHRDWNTVHAAPLAGKAAEHGNDPDPDRRLRIGYVSSDFRDHPVGRLVGPVIAAHDRSRVEIFAYSQASRPDDITHRTARDADVFRPIAALDDEALAETIRNDRIDVLVDLSGHGARNRLTVFGRRPAPVQATWLGYMSSTGLDAMDYLIGDPVHTPEGDDACYAETVMRLPNDLLCFDPPADAPEIVPPPCLDRGYVTFGCFNNPGKVTEPVLAAWARLLRAVPGARLFLRYPGYEDPGAETHFRETLAAHGVEGARLRIEGTVAYGDVLARYGDVDIALDTFPYSGTMTTLEALWMGVPVVAIRGERMVARQAAAHLAAVGLNALVADDVSGYVEIAASLARDGGYLSDLRGGMRKRLLASPLCDVSGFTRDLEAIYRDMWRRWCDGRRGDV